MQNQFPQSEISRRNEVAEAEAQSLANAKPQVTEIGNANEMVLSYSWGDGPDGYTGYYKYH